MNSNSLTTGACTCSAFLIIGALIVLVMLKKHEIKDQENKRLSWVGDDDPTEGLTSYVLQDSLLTPTERRFAETLFDVTAEEGMLVMCKVRIEDVVGVDRGLDYRLRQRHRGSIKSRHFDFVLVSPLDFRPLMAIELDDPSHNSKKAKAADRLKNHICGCAGFNLVRLNVSNNYSASKVANLIKRNAAR